MLEKSSAKDADPFADLPGGTPDEAEGEPAEAVNALPIFIKAAAK